MVCTGKRERERDRDRPGNWCSSTQYWLCMWDSAMTLRGRGRWSAQAWELMFFNSNIGFVCGILQWLLGEGVGGLHRREREGEGEGEGEEGTGTGLGTGVLQLNIGFVCGILQWLLGEGVGGLHRREGEGQAWELVFFNSILALYVGFCNDS